MERLGRASRFVTLQVANEMPGSLKIGECAKFPLPFLNAIFAKFAQSSVVGFANPKPSAFERNVREELVGLAENAGRLDLEDRGAQVALE